MAIVNCLICEKEMTITPPCFIQVCKECLKKIDWGDDHGKTK